MGGRFWCGVGNKTMKYWRINRKSICQFHLVSIQFGGAMTIPDFQTIMLPLLKLLGDGKERSIHEIVEVLAKDFKLSAQELAEMLPSSTQTVFYNRVGWARTYLSKSGLLNGRRKYYQISDRGKEALRKNPTRIDMAFLKQYPEFLEFRERKPKSSTPIIGPEPIRSTHPRRGS